MKKKEGYLYLEDVCTKIGSGATPKGGSTVYIDEGISLIRSQNVLNIDFSTAGLAHIDDRAAQKLNGVTVKPKDVLINITGDSVARCCLVPEEVLPARVNQHVSIIRPNGIDLDPVFLTYYLNLPHIQEYLLLIAMGKGASRKAITKEMLQKFAVEKIDIEKQKKIASVLLKYDESIKKTKQRISILQMYAELIYKKWFIDFDYPQKSNDTFSCASPKGWTINGSRDDFVIPTKWHFGELKELGEFKRGKNITADEMVYGDIPVISAGREASGYHNEANVFGTSLTISASGANAGLLMYHLEDIWAADCSYYQNDEYIWFVYNSLKFLQPVLTNLQRGSAQPHVYPKNINKVSLIIPEEKIIKKYSDLVSPLYAEIHSLHRKIDNLTKQRELLMPRLMNKSIEIKEVL